MLKILINLNIHVHVQIVMADRNLLWKLFDTHFQNMQNIQSGRFYPIFVLFFVVEILTKNLLILLVDENTHGTLFETHLTMKEHIKI